MNKKNVRNIIYALIIILIILIVIVVIVGGKSRKREEKVGFIVPGYITEKGYVGEHYMGIKKACDELGLELVYEEGVDDNNTGACKLVVDKMVKDGIKVIILCSYGYQVEMVGHLDEYPDVSFYCSSDMSDGNNFLFYFARVYQARYLSGILAGMMTKNNKIGYVAAMNNCEVNRGINAFTLGVKKVNKDANVYVYWTGAWDNGEVEKAHTSELIEKVGVDTITYHQNQTYVLDVAEEHGVYSIAYNIDTGAEGYSNNVLASVRSDWSTLYREILQDNFQNGGATKNMFWIGLEKDAVYLSNQSDLITVDMYNNITTNAADIKNGIDVFSNLIKDNDGNVVCNLGETMSDQTLMKSMDWYVDGVIIYE